VVKLDNPSSDSSENKTPGQAGPKDVDSGANKTTDVDKDINTESTTDIATGPSEEHAHEQNKEAHISELQKKPKANVSIKPYQVS
jgi:hypothetical protein